MADELNIYQRLNNVQIELKAPKGQYNSFSKFNYRSAEDILEAVKPINLANGLNLTISDTIEEIGGSNYIKATLTLVNIDNPEEKIFITAFAREAKTKKGMDDSQITGSSSSYARKYGLNGLYIIDDTKDADTDEYHNQTENIQKQAQQTQNVSSNTDTRTLEEQIDAGYDAVEKVSGLDKAGVDEKIEKKLGVDDSSEVDDRARLQVLLNIYNEENEKRIKNKKNAQKAK